MSDLFDLSGRRICVTGGYGHLGAAITQGLADSGAAVYVLGRDANKFDQCEFPDSVNFVPCDIASSESARDALGSVGGPLHGLINNAFYGRENEPLNISDEAWDYSLDGGLGSVYRMIREANGLFVDGDSKIVNVASMYGVIAPDFTLYEDAPQYLNPPQYGAAKAGVVQLTRYFASFLGTRNIQVNCVSPGPFPSAEVQKNTEFVAGLERRTLLRRIGRPDELQGTFVYLMSRASDYMTGQNLIIDGGWSVV